MNRRVSKPAAILLALVILSAPSAYAMPWGRDFNPDFGIGPRIVKILKQFGKKLGIISSLEDINAGPPKP